MIVIAIAITIAKRSTKSISTTVVQRTRYENQAVMTSVERCLLALIMANSVEHVALVLTVLEMRLLKSGLPGTRSSQGTMRFGVRGKIVHLDYVQNSV